MKYFHLELLDNWKISSSSDILESGKELSLNPVLSKSWLSCSVPTTVLGALVKNKVYEQPYFGENLKEIPTNPNFKSLNLSHSLIVISQLVFNLININKTRYTKSKKIRSATKNQIQAMTNLCIKNLEDRNFFKPPEKKPIMIENLRSIFYRMELSEKETRILSSVFASLSKKKVD